MKLGEYLIQQGQLSQEQLDEALKRQAAKTPHELLGEILVEMKAIDRQKLFQQLLSFTREKNPDQSVLKEWISQEEIDRLMSRGAENE